MTDRRFMLIVMEPSGRPVRRMGVSRRLVELWVGGVALLLLAGVLMLVHGVSLVDDAAESQALRDDNAGLRQILIGLERDLPEMRRIVFSNEVEFGQIWVKSGLGVEPRLVGVGPFEANAGPEGERPTAAGASDVLSLDTVALPLEEERISEDGRIAQQELGELLEYFHDAARLLSNTPSVRPVRSPWITSTFGMRKDPMNGAWMMHKGLDIGGQIGTEVVAPADGVVIFVGQRGGYGNTVVIDHGYGLQTHFAHLSKQRVAMGDRVRRGDPIADMGTSGKSTGPHLHYEVRRWGRPLDPARFVLD